MYYVNIMLSKMEMIFGWDLKKQCMSNYNTKIRKHLSLYAYLIPTHFMILYTIVYYTLRLKFG